MVVAVEEPELVAMTVTVRDCTVELEVFVIQIVAVLVLADSAASAAEFVVSVRVTAAFDPTLPLVLETLNHDDVLTNVQEKASTFVLVKTKLEVLGVNGPPTGPAKVGPVIGWMTMESLGGASALIKACPLGVPKPVQR